MRDGMRAREQVSEAYAKDKVRSRARCSPVAVGERMDPVQTPHHVGGKMQGGLGSVVVYVLAEVIDVAGDFSPLRRLVLGADDLDGFRSKRARRLDEAFDRGS